VQFSWKWICVRCQGDFPGLELGVQARPAGPLPLRLAVASGAVPDADGIRWPLQPGALNRIELVLLALERLGVGAVVILVLLGLALGTAAAALGRPVLAGRNCLLLPLIEES